MVEINQTDQTFLCESKNGITVTYDLKNPHLSTHLADTPNLKELAIEAIGKINLDGELFASDVDTGRIVGTCDVVDISDKDQVIYGIRKNRFLEGLVPFVKNRGGEPSTFVSLFIEPRNNDTYELGSAWIGRFEDEPFPLAPNANDKSLSYWSAHAFVYGSQEIEPGTKTLVKPW